MQAMNLVRNLAAALLLAAAVVGPAAAQDSDIVYELRTYTAAPGTLATLSQNFEDTVIPLFEKHGMTNVGYWTPTDPADERIIYLLSYDDRAARDAAWDAFAADPDFAAMMAERQEGGFMPIQFESVLLEPTDYSPSGGLEPAAAPRVFEFRTYSANEGKFDALNARFRDHTLGFFERHGMTNVAYFSVLPGQETPADTLIYLLAYPDQAARDAAWRAFAADPEWATVAAASEADGPLLSARPGSIMAAPTDYSAVQ